jgi:putative phosphoribosyl transferase
MEHNERAVRRFRDRHEAGALLADALSEYHGQSGLLVLALPRGGVPVAEPVARALDAELDVLLVRKLGCPGRSEFAMGAIASDGGRILDERTVALLHITPEQIAEVEQRERAELERREKAYRGARPPPRIAGRTVILVDDGLATGASMKAAIAALRTSHARRVVVAVPVAPAAAEAEFSRLADDFVCVLSPVDFHAVGLWYRDFDQVGDAQVKRILAVSVPPAGGQQS